MEFDATGLSEEVLLHLYRSMLQIRNVELEIEARYEENEMRTPIHPCIGQEATAVGVCANLTREDYVFSNHRGHGHYLAKKGDLKAMIAELYNKETGCSRGRGGSMHLIDVSVGLPGSSSIVGGGIPLATGAALAFFIRGEKRVAVAFFGDGAVEEGVLYESVNFAMLKRLPVIFVCENNFYSVCSPLAKRQVNYDIYRRFTGLDLPSFQVDGNNVLEVYRVAGKAIEAARRGEGPSFIEGVTYRFRDHHGTKTGIELGYRTQEEYDRWLEICPVASFERFLREANILTQAEFSRVKEEIRREIDEAFRYAEESPLPRAEDLLAGLHR